VSRRCLMALALVTSNYEAHLTAGTKYERDCAERAKCWYESVFGTSDLHTISESKLVLGLTKLLAKDFYIDPEVWGTDLRTGKRLRIDAVLTPKRPEDWPDPLVRFGFEFKALNKQRPQNILRQAIDYRYTKWDDYGFLTIIMAPPLQLHDGELRGELVAFIGALSIGELWFRNRGYGHWTTSCDLVMSIGGTKVWSSVYGPTNKAGYAHGVNRAGSQ